MNISIESLYQIFLQHRSICTDTRKLKEGDLYIALKGDHFDGNRFAAAALQAGAAYALVDDPTVATDERFLLTGDSLNTLQQLALHHRRQFSIPVLAITGSNGKTTTKELVHAVLSRKYKTYTTRGNLNNHIGIPLTLLSIGDDAEMAVVEMGANHQREIASYCSYTEPTHGMITNCGKAHLEGFGGIEGVRKGKGELFDYLRSHQGTAFVYADTDYFGGMTPGIEDLRWYGREGNYLNGQVHAGDPFLEVAVQWDDTNSAIIPTQLVGIYNLSNVLAACAIGKYFEVSTAEIKEAISGYAPDNIRSQRVVKDGNTYVMDAYNANPNSMAEAIRNFASLQHHRKVMLLGAMKEMGDAEHTEHQALVDLIGTYNWQDVVLVGQEFEGIAHPYRYFATANEAAAWWQENKPQDALILVKGSRGIQMEKVVNL